jgi:hypothetical protein
VRAHDGGRGGGEPVQITVAGRSGYEPEYRTCFRRPWTQCGVQVLSVPPQIADNRRCNAFIPREPRGPSVPMIIAFHFATLVHVLGLGNDATASQRHARLWPFGGGMLYQHYSVP